MTLEDDFKAIRDSAIAILGKKPISDTDKHDAIWLLWEEEYWKPRISEAVKRERERIKNDKVSKVW